MVMDDQRNCLYTLNDKSEVTCIYLGTDGHGFTKLEPFTNLTQILREQTDISRFEIGRAPSTIIELDLVPISESNHICLVGTLSNGTSLKILDLLKVNEFTLQPLLRHTILHRYVWEHQNLYYYNTLHFVNHP